MPTVRMNIGDCLGTLFSLAMLAAACGISAVQAVHWFDRYNVVPPQVESDAQMRLPASAVRQPPVPVPAPEK